MITSSIIPPPGALGQPALQALHATPLRSVAHIALRSGSPKATPSQLHP